MPNRVWFWVIASLVACAGCFRDGAALLPAEAAPRLLTVAAFDATSAAWPLDAIPRAPRFVLTFDRPVDEPVEGLFLIDGELDAALRDDLADRSPRAETTPRLVTLALHADGAQVEAQPLSALAAGTRYSLVWVTAEASSGIAIDVSESPAAGAQWVESLPAHGASGVAPNLARLLLRFDGYLGEIPGGSVQLTEGQELALPVELAIESCANLGFGEGDCLWVTLQAPLRETAHYQLSLGPGLRDATGVELPPLIVAFDTAAEADLLAPALLEVGCALDELQVQTLCALASDSTLGVRGLADEPARITLVMPPRSASVLSFGDGFSLALEALAAPGPAFIRLTDAAGNVRDVALRFEPADELAQVSVDEVRADPLGAEPDQEYVELLNFGTEPVQLMGFSLSDDAFAQGPTLTSPRWLQPGERVLVVGPSFERADSADGELGDGVELARLEAPLSLRNDGSAVFLRDARQRRLSAAPALGPARAGQCIARKIGDPRSGAERAFARDPSGGCTPGLPTFPPLEAR